MAQVTGASLREEAAVETRKRALGIVDSLSQDETGHLGDENLADALTQVAAAAQMQFVYGEQEAAFVTIRGLPVERNLQTISRHLKPPPGFVFTGGFEKQEVNDACN